MPHIFSHDKAADSCGGSEHDKNSHNLFPCKAKLYCNRHENHYQQKQFYKARNKCGFHIVEYFNEHHEDPDFTPQEAGEYPGEDDGLFRLVKVMA